MIRSDTLFLIFLAPQSKKLIASVNILPIESMYWWKGKINEEREFMVIAKTLEKKFGEIREEIKRVHSYTVPCILKIDVEADGEFLRWVGGEVKKCSPLKIAILRHLP